MTAQARNLVLHPSGLESTNDSGDWFPVPESGIAALWTDITAMNGTSPTLDLNIEVRDPTTGKTAVLQAMTQRGATGIFREAVNAFPDAEVRLAWTIGGTGGPDVTFSATLVVKED